MIFPRIKEITPCERMYFAQSNIYIFFSYKFESGFTSVFGKVFQENNKRMYKDC